MWTRGAKTFGAGFGRSLCVTPPGAESLGETLESPGVRTDVRFGCPNATAFPFPRRGPRHGGFGRRGRNGICGMCRLHKTVDGRNIRFLFRFDRGYVLDSGTVGEGAAGSGGGIRMPVPSGGSDPCRPERCGRDVRRGPSRSRSACGRETAGPSGRFRDKPEAEEGESDIFA